jgi:pimeloyl-ACP methyl ester carboxylesterase
MNLSKRATMSTLATTLAASAAAGLVSACGGASAATEASTTSPVAQSFPTQRETIVLLHGSWHGSWCWYKVRPLLLAAGYDTLTPTLTGLAERSGYGSLSVGLRSHANEVARFLEINNLSNVVLVGHSYSGLILSEVAETMSSRIKRLVYLDAFAVNDGEAAFDFFPPDFRDLLINLATTGNGWGFPPPPVDDLVGADGPAADKALLTQWLTPMPVNTHSEKVVAPTNKWATLAKTYISCKKFPNLDAIKARVRAQSGWTYQEIDTHHDCMLTTPQALATLLIQAAATPA